MVDEANEVEISQNKSPRNKNNNANSEMIAPIRFVVVFLAATLISAIAIELLITGNDENKPRFAIFNNDTEEYHLVHVINLLQRFGYRRVSLEDDNWDFLWVHEYPFITLQQRMKNLKSHQIVNHIAGFGYITSKVNLSLTPLPFLPRAFQLPEQKTQFLEYAQSHPDSLFVQKHVEHRHIKILKPSAIDLNSNTSFVQEFLQKPFLVDGYKFDIGIYVTITSIDPLRAYIYTGDVLFRYCPKKYHPFDAADVDKYIVGDNYLPTWEVPALKKYLKFGGSMRGAFDAYVREQSLDPTRIWTQVEDIIRKTLLDKQQNILYFANRYKVGKFFELTRIDLFIDENLKVYLMEANLSPNLSSAHFKPNALLYEQVLYSVLNLVGIGSPLNRIFLAPSTNETMVTAEKNLAINLIQCAEYNCDESCNTHECSLCMPCMSGSEYEILVDAHREHLHKIDMKRIFPKSISNPETFDIEAEVQNMTKKNEWITRWFYGKCQYEYNWCF